MLRALVVIVLLANALFWGWSRGWFAPLWQAPRHAEREPERLAAQVRPESVTVLPPKAATAAVTAARAAAAVCLEAGPVPEPDIVVAEATLVGAQLPAGTWSRETLPAPPQWLVFAGRVPDAAARRTREEELRKAGVTFEKLDAPPELAPGLVLSRHASRAEADAALAKQTVKGLRVVSLPAPPLRYWLRVPRADADVQARLLALGTVSPAGGFKPCADR
jgi:hypothetical protein